MKIRSKENKESHMKRKGKYRSKLYIKKGGAGLALPLCLKQQQQRKDRICETAIFKTVDVRQ